MDRTDIAHSLMVADWIAQGPEAGVYQNDATSAAFKVRARLYFRAADAFLEVAKEEDDDEDLT